MSVDITITLSDEDLDKFQESVDKGKVAVEDSASAAQFEEAAGAMIEQARSVDLLPFIADRLLKLQILLNMIRDEEWQLSDDERNSIRSALYYFVDPEYVIPDHIPGIGFLDDALYAEIVI